MLASWDFYYLFDKADTYAQAGEYQQTIDCYSQLIRSYPDNAGLYLRRASTYSELYDFESAVQDSRIATELDPDNASPYWLLGGYLLSRELVKSGSIIASNNKQCFDEIILNYKLALEKDPGSQAAWLNIIEISLLMRYWDDAISYYGASGPYITSSAYTLVRSFLGCLAITLAGDKTEKEDEKSLHDHTIRIARSNYRFGEVTALIHILHQFIADINVIERAKAIYTLFLSHYGDNPKCNYQRLQE